MDIEKLNNVFNECEKYEYFKRFKKDTVLYKAKLKVEDTFINKYIYINDWVQFLDIYRKFKDIKKDILFYEELENNCKFYIDININKYNINLITKKLSYIKKELHDFFKKNMKINVDIIIYQEENIINSICRFIVQNYVFNIEDCKYLYYNFLLNIDDEIKNNICFHSFYDYNSIIILNTKLYDINVNMFITNTDSLPIINIPKKFLKNNGFMNLICKKNLNSENKNIINFENYEEGYLYIIIEREFIRMKEKIYKVGCTNDIIRRYKQYPKKSKIIYTIIHKDYKEIEKKWILNLNLKQGNNKKRRHRKRIL